MNKGKVILVGGGPGDPGLISVRGMECIRRADVIVYDHLVDERLLGNASPEAEKIYVGKSAGQHALEQTEINQLLVDKAVEGKAVVRLKGGDPFVFGRGGEEAETLVECGIEYEVVPGITSAIAVPAYAGIPVTHRGLASSFAVITGHEDPGKESSSINWQKLATATDTLVFLMGMRNLPQIVSKLVENGRSPETPAAVIKDGTSPRQKTITGCLSDIVEKAEEAKLTPPVIIVVGDVVSLREKLRWFDNRPLSGKRVLVTRSRHQASALSRLLMERGAQPVELPVIDIRPLADNSEMDNSVINLKKYDWVFFTSANGVEAFFKRLSVLKLDSRTFGGLKVGAIGPATASALEEKGIVADYLPAVYTTEGIVEGLTDYEIKGKRFLLPRADIADKELVAGLKRLGAEVHEVVAYTTVPATETIFRARQMLQSGEIDIVTFTSSSTVSTLMAALGDDKMSGVKTACIGPKTAETARKTGLKVDILASEQTIHGLVFAIEEYFRKEN